MRAWLMDGYEGVENLHLGEVAVPEPGPGQVLLKVRFAALNPADAFLAQAMYPAKPPLPHVLGRDGVGEVVAVGTGVDKAHRIGGVAVSDYERDGAQGAWKRIVERLDAIGKRPLVDRVFAFEDIKAAFARLAQGPMGKVLVHVVG